MSYENRFLFTNIKTLCLFSFNCPRHQKFIKNKYQTVSYEKKAINEYFYSAIQYHMLHTLMAFTHSRQKTHTHMMWSFLGSLQLSSLFNSSLIFASKLSSQHKCILKSANKCPFPRLFPGNQSPAQNGRKSHDHVMFVVSADWLRVHACMHGIAKQ